MKFFSFDTTKVRARWNFQLSREQFILWGILLLGCALIAVVAWGSYSFYRSIFSEEMQIVSPSKTAFLSEKEIDEVMVSIKKREKLFHELLER